MKSLSEKIKEINEILMDEVIVDGIIFIPNFEIPKKIGELIIERKDHFPQIPGTRYTFRKDNPRGTPGPGNLKHIHIYAPNNKELFSINIDGSAHDGCHGAKIPEDIVTFLTQLGYQVPANRIIEWYPESTHSTEAQLLLD